MLDEKDIQKLLEVLATKEDIKDLNQQFNGLQEMVQSLVVSVDKLVKAVSDLHQEYAMVTSKIDRHEKWIQKLADKLGIRLEY